MWVRVSPYGTYKSRIHEQIAEAVEDEKVVGVADIRDESDRDGLRLVVEMKADGDAEAALNQIYKATDLQVSFGYNGMALKVGTGFGAGNRLIPELMNLKAMIGAFIDHRRDVIRRRSEFELNEGRDKLHVQAGLLMALEDLDETIRIIRAAPNPAEARASLMARAFVLSRAVEEVLELDIHASAFPGEDAAGRMVWRLTETQAQAILDLRLHKLTGLERDEIVRTAQEFVAKIRHLMAILNNPSQLTEELIRELEQTLSLLDTPRLTQIDEVAEEDGQLSVVPLEDVIVTFTASGYIKRVPLAAFRTQKRGGQGKTGMKTKAESEDAVTLSIAVTTHDSLLVFIDKGMCYAIRVHEIPAGDAAWRGKPIVQLCEHLKDQRITAVLPMPDREDLDENSAMIFVTNQGDVRRTSPADFARVNANGKIAMKFENDKENAELVSVMMATESDDVMMSTATGNLCRFPVADLREMASRISVGVRGISLGFNDRVVGAAIVPHGTTTPEERDLYLKCKDAPETSGLSAERWQELEATERFLLTVSALGYGKRSSTHEYRTTARGGKGVGAAKLNSDTGPLVAVMPVDSRDGVMVTTVKGIVIRVPAAQLAIQGRTTRGNRIMALAKGDQVATVMRLIAEDEGEGGIEGEGGAAEPHGSSGGEPGAPVA